MYVFFGHNHWALLLFTTPHFSRWWRRKKASPSAWIPSVTVCSQSALIFFLFHWTGQSEMLILQDSSCHRNMEEIHKTRFPESGKRSSKNTGLMTLCVSISTSILVRRLLLVPLDYSLRYAGAQESPGQKFKESCVDSHQVNGFTRVSTRWHPPNH